MSARVVVSLDDAIVGEVELTKPATVIGRRPDCDVVLEHPAISGRHAVLRLEGRAVFVEDLASTNGVRVNGLPCSRQLVQHLDLIELGRHKVHFFDDKLLVKGLDGLESTVQADYESTLVAPRGLDDTASDAPAPAPAQLAVTQPLDATQAIARPDPAFLMPPAAGESPALRIAAGPRTGERLPLQQTHTMVGTAGAETALVVRRGRSFFLARFSGSASPRLNGREIGPGTHAIAEGDSIEVGALRYELILQPESR